MDDLLTVAEVASILRCNDDTVRSLIRSGRLSASDIRTGRRSFYRVPRAAIDAYLASSSVVCQLPTIPQRPTLRKPKHIRRSVVR